MSYEAGFKARLWDGRARLNGTAYFYEVDDMQFTAIGGDNNTNRLLNANKGVGKGIEIDGDVYLGAGFTFAGGFAWNDTEIKDNALSVPLCTGGCTITDPLVNVGGTNRASVNGNPFPMAPEYSANFVLSYVKSIGNDQELFAATDWVMQKNTNIFLYESKEFMLGTQFEGGLRAGWRHLGRDVEVAGYVRNITDEDNILGAIDFNNLTVFVNDPRMYGIEISKRF
jgi:iron complex outermembrane receptor protein